MTEIRPATPDDLEALYRIALATGDNGADATALYEDPRLVGHIYAAPYAVLSPDTAFVAEDADGVAGYIVGALDTRAFEVRLERDWWPPLRTRYADPSDRPLDAWSADEMRAWLIHHPYPTPERVLSGHPSHLHINLLPRLQGQGMGKALIDQLLVPLEDEWLAGKRQNGVTARVKAIRTAILPDLVTGTLTEEERNRRWRHLADVYLAQQLALYPQDYFSDPPAATCCKSCMIAEWATGSCPLRRGISPFSIMRVSVARARPTRLLMVPTAHLQIAAASS